MPTLSFRTPATERTRVLRRLAGVPTLAAAAACGLQAFGLHMVGYYQPLFGFPRIFDLALVSSIALFFASLVLIAVGGRTLAGVCSILMLPLWMVYGVAIPNVIAGSSNVGSQLGLIALAPPIFLLGATGPIVAAALARDNKPHTRGFDVIAPPQKTVRG
jgi:hypothetical protein